MIPAVRTLFIIQIFFVATLVSCYPEPEELIPAYIHIEQIDLTTTSGQGTASHKITDAWVYIGQKLIGAFELPATFPILETGLQEITIRPGIKISGISATRAPYPFYSPIVKTVELEAGATHTLTSLYTAYNDNVNFIWMEDFNRGTLSIDTTSNSETRLVRISDANHVFRYGNEVNEHSAMAWLQGDTILFECASVNSFALPKGGAPVFLEMNYKNDFNITVGLYIVISGQVFQHPVLILTPTEVWNKIYINFTPTITEFYNSTDFKVFIGFLKPSDIESATIYLDHLKLIY